jgi:MoaA/NifB/PqqE/SkfB family radical SAM enzyme
MDITGECGMNCLMCRYHSPLLKKNADKESCHMPLDRFGELIIELAELKTRTVMLTGEGEPLLHPDIMKMIKIVRQRGMDVELMTNAYHLTGDKADAFAAAGVKKILVSLHAADAETFCAIRPECGGEGFRRIMENLRYFASLRVRKPALFIINVISALNWRSVSEMAALAEDLEADKILFKPLTVPRDFPGFLRISPGMAAGLDAGLRETLSILKIANNIDSYRAYLRMKRRGFKHAENYPEQPVRVHRANRLSCYIPWMQSVIGLKGDVFGCAYAQKTPLGNICNNTFRDVWFGGSYNRFRRGVCCFPGCAAGAVYPFKKF